MHCTMKVFSLIYDTLSYEPNETISVAGVSGYKSIAHPHDVEVDQRLTIWEVSMLEPLILNRCSL